MPETNGNAPATRADVRALETKMEGRLQQLEDKVDRLEDKMDRQYAELRSDIKRMATEQTEQMQEFVRDIQTELLRGFDAFAGGFDIRMRKVQSDITNVDAATDRRLLILERRMVELEKRLPPLPPPPS